MGLRGRPSLADVKRIVRLIRNQIKVCATTTHGSTGSPRSSTSLRYHLSPHLGRRWKEEDSACTPERPLPRSVPNNACFRLQTSSFPTTFYSPLVQVEVRLWVRAVIWVNPRSLDQAQPDRSPIASLYAGILLGSACPSEEFHASEDHFVSRRASPCQLSFFCR